MTSSNPFDTSELSLETKISQLQMEVANLKQQIASLSNPKILIGHEKVFVKTPFINTHLDTKPVPDCKYVWAHVRPVYFNPENPHVNLRMRQYKSGSFELHGNPDIKFSYQAEFHPVNPNELTKANIKSLVIEDIYQLKTALNDYAYLPTVENLQIGHLTDGVETNMSLYPFVMFPNLSTVTVRNYTHHDEGYAGFLKALAYIPSLKNITVTQSSGSANWNPNYLINKDIEGLYKAGGISFQVLPCPKYNYASTEFYPEYQEKVFDFPYDEFYAFYNKHYLNNNS